MLQNIPFLHDTELLNDSALSNCWHLTENSCHPLSLSIERTANIRQESLAIDPARCGISSAQNFSGKHSQPTSSLVLRGDLFSALHLHKYPRNNDVYCCVLIEREYVRVSPVIEGRYHVNFDCLGYDFM